jgi:rhodanese-related sulfurtransferase
VTSGGRDVSPQWSAWRARIDLDEYEARFRHSEAHGEADLIEALVGQLHPSGGVLDAGCGTGRVAIELARRGIDVVGADLDDDMLALARAKAPEVSWMHIDLATMQLHRRFGIVAMPGNVMLFCREVDRRSVVHSCVQHLQPGGLLVAGFGCDSSLTLADYDALCDDCELTLVQRWATWDRQPYDGGAYAVSVHRRSQRFNVHDLLFAARDTFDRCQPHELAARLRSDDPPLVVDTRTPSDRQRFGVIAGSIHVPRTVLEWHLDPANGYRHPAVSSFDQPLVVVCNGGYSSTLGAANLVALGFTHVSDLVGGMSGWIAAGGAVEPPDHTHLGR